MIVIVFFLFLWLFIPSSFSQTSAVLPIKKEISKFIITLIDLSDGILCTFIIAAFLFKYLLWRSDIIVIVGVALFLSGLLLTYNYIAFLITPELQLAPFSWFITHCYFTLSLACSLALTLYGSTYVLVYKKTFVICAIAFLFLLWSISFLAIVFVDHRFFPFYTDRILLYFHLFEAVPFLFYFILCFPLQILFFRKEKRYASYGLLFSSIPFLIAYVINLLSHNERYFQNITYYGVFELFGFITIAIGAFADNFGIYHILKQNKERAELLTEAKSNFISSFSYQLRSPLNSVIGFAECLEEGIDGALNEKQKKSVSQIKKASAKLLKLIEEIIDISQIESGKISYEVTQFSIIEACKHLTEMLAPKAQEKTIQLKSEFPEKDLFINADEMRVKQVLFHLLDNGIKYTNQGSVTIRLEESPTTIIIHVIDTGKGIPKNELPTLFEPYTHLHKESNEEETSLGIGLSIARLIANALDAKIEVQSEEGKGSIFSFILQKE